MKSITIGELGIVKARSCSYSPSHITGFFEIRDNKNPLYKGSVGCGMTLEAGCVTEVSVFVTDDFSGKTEIKIKINGVEEEANTTRYVVEQVTKKYDVGYDNVGIGIMVETRFDVPVGCGFGASGAGALSTALALNEVFSLHLTMNELAQIAHCAEVENGTGLGDVIAQTYGGVVIRKEPGPPGIGEIDKILSGKIGVNYVVVDKGERSTKAVLDDVAMRRRINAGGKKAMKELLKKPCLENFMLVSRKFSTSTEITNDRCRDAIEAVDAEGKVASVAMIGKAIFVIGESEALSEFGEVKRSRISLAGADMAGAFPPQISPHRYR